MATIRIAILDERAGTKTTVELPDDVPMNQLIPALVESLGLPVHQAGNLIAYHLDHMESGQRVGQNETLDEAGINEGDVVALLPEVTAGDANR